MHAKNAASSNRRLECVPNIINITDTRGDPEQTGLTESNRNHRGKYFQEIFSKTAEESRRLLLIYHNIWHLSENLTSRSGWSERIMRWDTSKYAGCLSKSITQTPANKYIIICVEFQSKVIKFSRNTIEDTPLTLFGMRRQEMSVGDRAKLCTSRC